MSRIRNRRIREDYRNRVGIEEGLTFRSDRRNKSWLLAAKLTEPSPQTMLMAFLLTRSSAAVEFQWKLHLLDSRLCFRTIDRSKPPTELSFELAARVSALKFLSLTDTVAFALDKPSRTFDLSIVFSPT